MKNPTVAGMYWVWRRPKDVDRNLFALLDWCDGRWHHDEADWNDGSPHAREFAAWSGPIPKPLPPQSEEEVAAEYARGGPGEIRAASESPAPLCPRSST